MMAKKPPVGFRLLLVNKQELKISTGNYLREGKSSGKMKDNNNYNNKSERTVKNGKDLGEKKLDDGKGKNKGKSDNGIENNSNNNGWIDKNDNNGGKAKRKGGKDGKVKTDVRNERRMMNNNNINGLKEIDDKNGGKAKNNEESKGKRKDQDEKEERNTRAEASAKMGEDRAQGRTKGPCLDREEALVVGKTLAKTCDWDSMRRTLEELGGRWIAGGTFFHFYEEDRVVTWLSEGFWFVVERELVVAVVVDGWMGHGGCHVPHSGRSEAGGGGTPVERTVGIRRVFRGLAGGKRDEQTGANQ